MEIENILNVIKDELKDVAGVVGIVLGGSRARGTHRAISDIDIGIYYSSPEEFDVSAVNKIATKLDDDHRENLVTSLGEWGNWINGGGWLIVQGYHVDLIFRDIRKVAKVIDECLAGHVSSHYHTGHPHAYINVMYMGELAICKVLHEKENQISALKGKTSPYSKALKDALTGYFMFEASFSLMFARDNVDKDDSSYVMGHCFRSISCLNQVLFALNEQYCINEKKAVKMIETFQSKPDNYKERIDQVVSLISSNPEYTNKGIEVLQELISETEEILAKKDD